MTSDTKSKIAADEESYQNFLERWTASWIQSSGGATRVQDEESITRLLDRIRVMEPLRS
jgi:hypothetical protein